MIQKAIRGGVPCGSGGDSAPAKTVSAAAAGGQKAASAFQEEQPKAAGPAAGSAIVAHPNGLLELNQGPVNQGPPPPLPEANSSTHAKEWARWQRRIRQNAKSGMFPSQQAAYFQGGKAKLDAFSIFVAANGNQAAVEARMLQAGLMFTGCHAE